MVSTQTLSYVIFICSQFGIIPPPISLAQLAPLTRVILVAKEVLQAFLSDELELFIEGGSQRAVGVVEVVPWSDGGLTVDCGVRRNRL